MNHTICALLLRLSLGIMFSRLVHAAAWIRTSSFYIYKISDKCFMAQTPRILFTQPSVDGCLLPTWPVWISTQEHLCAGFLRRHEVFESLGHVSSCGMTESRANSAVSILRDCQTLFPSLYTTLHSQGTWVRILISSPTPV